MSEGRQIKSVVLITAEVLPAVYNVGNYILYDMVHSFLFSSIDGVALINEDGGLRVFFPNNSFVTNTTLTNTNTPPDGGNDHIACYGGDPQGAQVTWHNSGGPLQVCLNGTGQRAPCITCGPICQGNGAVGVSLPLNGRTDIHVFTTISAFVNQDLECRVNVSGGQSAFIGVYLSGGGE